MESNVAPVCLKLVGFVGFDVKIFKNSRMSRDTRKMWLAFCFVVKLKSEFLWV